jgi:Fic family protein
METNETILQLNALMEQLNVLLPLKQADEKRLSEKLRLEFNYNSNHIEGNTLTYGQTKMLLLFDKSIGDVPVSDLEEMKAHDVAFSQIKQFAADTERPLTEQFIRELNKTILVKPFWKEAITPGGMATSKKIEIGTYKTLPNSVRLKNGDIHEYASPEETPAKMQELIEWYRTNETTMHPVRLAAEFHYRFVCIHPFDDGNGRVARLVMNYILMKKKHPPVIIKSDDKEAYLTALQKADIGDVEAIVDYVAQQLTGSIELYIKASKGEDLFETGDIEKEIALLKRQKLTHAKIHRTPKTAFELTNHIKNNVWPKIEKALSGFDDFFAENKTSIYVNRKKIEKTKIITTGLLGSSSILEMIPHKEKIVVKPYELWENDFEEENVNNVSWQHKKLALKSASKKTDFAIHLNLFLGNEIYELSIEINNVSLFTDKRDYSILYMNSDIEKIIRIISSQLLQMIKEAK